MSFRSVLVVHHDALGEIERDEEFGKSMRHSINLHSITKQPVEVSIRGCTGYAYVCAQADRDVPLLLAVNGLRGTVLSFGDYGGNEEGALRRMASLLGFDLVPSRKKAGK